ncbi:MAG: hypothetical protein R2867_42240 [Caldilineaceae bacterium]
MINDILDLCKIESGQVELIDDTVDVLAVCDSSLPYSADCGKLESKSIFTIDPAVKVMLADGRRLKQILIDR